MIGRTCITHVGYDKYKKKKVWLRNVKGNGVLAILDVDNKIILKHIYMCVLWDILH